MFTRRRDCRSGRIRRHLGSSAACATTIKEPAFKDLGRSSTTKQPWKNLKSQKIDSNWRIEISKLPAEHRIDGASNAECRDVQRDIFWEHFFHFPTALWSRRKIKTRRFPSELRLRPYVAGVGHILPSINVGSSSQHQLLLRTILSR
jgi:hypothetical protein